MARKRPRTWVYSPLSGNWRKSLVLLFAASLLAGSPVALPLRAASPQPAALEPANTYAVIVGVLHWKNRGLTSFPTDQRKDRALYDTLRQRGVPADHMGLLLDEQATLDHIRQTLRAIARKAPADATLIFYYAGHGWRTPKGDTGFANFDYDAGRADRPELLGSEVAATLRREFRGRRVLLFADCCYSGGLCDVARRLVRDGYQAVALTAADARCVSTDKWTFTQTLVDGLAGDALLDTNGEGTITLGELAGEVALAMQFRERQRAGYAALGLSSEYRLATVDRSKRPLEPTPGPFALREYVTARDGKGRRSGRVVGYRDGRYVVEFFSYSAKERALLPAAALSRLTFPTYPVGQTMVLARPGLPRVRILEVVGAFHRVASEGQGAGEAEWVLASALVQDPRSVAEVEWHGAWYPATVLKTQGERYYIHYVDDDDSWDEWVGRSRIRFLGRTRNPFGVADVSDPDGQDVRAFAARVHLSGGDRDRNAEPWVKQETPGRAGTLDGEWSGRWDGGTGTARVQVVKDRVFILYTERDGRAEGTYLLEAIREGKDRLVGRWVQVGHVQDSGPFVGRIVSDERIDGAWGADARWDFRRRRAK
jgi:hypothetical protein